jgi:spermidine synthase
MSSQAPAQVSHSSLRSLQLWGGALFFFSGLTGLIYEILWTRRLNLTFGHSLLSVSTVVTAYMGGLALGSALGGRYSDRRVQAREKASWFLAGYGLLEIFVGLWAFVSLPLLGWVERFYLEMSSRGMQGLSLHLLAFAASILVLLPPTTAMGATLPVVSCLYNNQSTGLGRILSRLYSTNTFGALTGVAVAGFFLLPTLGLRLSVTLAGALNLVIGFVAYAVSRQVEGRLEAAPDVPSAPAQEVASHAVTWVLPLGFGITGALSMALQMGWTRSLSLSLGSSVYAFSVILMVFLGGIAVGSALYSRLLGGARPGWTHLAGITAGVGLTAGLAIPLLGRLPLLFLAGFEHVRHSYALVLVLDVVLCCLVLFLPTVLMGLSFPLVTELYHKTTGRVGRSVGSIYSANTLGCILGSFLAGFVLIPSIGVQHTLELAAFGSTLVAALYAAQVQPRMALVLALAGCWVFRLPRWDTGLLSEGLATHGSLTRAAGTAVLPHKPVYYRDGLSATVSVLIWSPGGLTLKVNGKPEASLGLPDRINQTFLGLLPLFYAKEPQRVGVIGLGSGLTLVATASCPGVQEAECAELEPYVIEADRYWAAYNRQVLSDPRVRARYADGRTMIMGAARPYDILVSVPSNPWVAGIGNLYTQDFYRSARSKLTEDGVFCQWVNLYSLSPEDLAMVMRTFGSVFPEGELWTIGGDLALVGGANARNCSLELLQKYYAQSSYLRFELAELGFLDPAQLLGAYLCPLQVALQKVPAGPLNTDDNPRLEYSAPLSMYRADSFAQNIEFVRELRAAHASPPQGMQWNAAVDQQASLGSLAFAQIRNLRPTTGPSLQSGWSSLFDLFLRHDQHDEAVRGQRREWARQHGSWHDGLARLAHSMVLNAEFAEILHIVPASIPKRPAQEYFWRWVRAQARYQTGQWSGAAEDYAWLQAVRPFADFQSALAYCSAKLQRWEEAEKFAQDALRSNPYDPRAKLVRAWVAQRANQTAQAQELTTWVTEACPFLQEAWLLRAQLLAQQGRRGETRAVIENYLQFFPGDRQVQALLNQL